MKIREICEEIEKKFHNRAPEWFKKWMEERNITWRKPFLTEAPILLFVFTDIKVPMSIQSTWIAIGYLLLALEEKGLKMVTYTLFSILWANNIFKIPENYKLQTILPIGKKKHLSKYKKQERLPLRKILYLEEYSISPEDKDISNWIYRETCKLVHSRSFNIMSKQRILGVC